MKKKKVLNDDDEFVTKGYLKKELAYRFGLFHLEIRREIKEESHSLEFRLIERMDRGFVEMRGEMAKLTDRFQQLADLVIGEHKNFESELASIKHNYHYLEE